MEGKNKYEQLKEAIGGFQRSTWIDDTEKKIGERPWRQKSQMIAIRILLALKVKGIRQSDLAELLGVSPQLVNKWVKGSENFTLETISRLEQALGIALIEIAKTPNNDIIQSRKTEC